MSYHAVVSGATLVCAATLLGCSSESPVTVAPNAVGGTAEFAAAAAGVYELSFFTTSLQPVTTLPACTQSPCSELVLGAHVESATGAPAQSGSVSFQYCSYSGLPPNDITRADEAPSSACANGTARWKSLTSVSVNASGNAFMDFGIVRIARTVGFRFKFTGQKNGIASGVSGPRDFTWF
ncbi:MAG TPA: hypothetical protein VGP95_17020 [Gemmatimonadaceae bacterium]|jgi:hypothetical protein|nr:hypothetical protein [Gemmatimonadaceae bacterium]